jgi:glutamate synthase domain-containing protein 2
MKSIDYLRGLGYKRIYIETGSYGMEALAMAIKFASEANLDLLTIDGSGGGTGMQPLEYDGKLGSSFNNVTFKSV